MNRLIRCVISFVLPFFCLLISVSYAEFSTTPLDDGDAFSASTNIGTNSCGGYTFNQIEKITYNRFVNGGDDYISVFDTMVENLTANDIKFLVIEPKSSDENYLMFIGNSNISIGGYIDVNDKLNLFFAQIDPSKKSGEVNRIRRISVTDLSTTYATSVLIDGSPDFGYEYRLSYTVAYSNVDIKKIVYSGGPTWDGTTYYYTTEQNTPTNPDEPTMPTNAEIASVVQAFYDSDLYKKNSNFKDFMVVYSFVTGYYSIIGTDNHLLQEIYYDGAKPSNDDFTHPETWWRFYNYFGNVQNFFYGWDYWLYSTRKENDVFLPLEYNGVGKINDLFNLKFTNQSIIVYSSYEYEVYEFRPPTEEGGENQVINTTVPGDEYTYNENLDPTDSNYSPIQNYIPTNPSQTILGDVDFDEINKTFEENKDILNIEGASWLFTANNKLVGYFIGLLSLLIVFLIISRILGG